MGLPRLRHPRDPTSLRRRPLVLGLYSHQSHCRRYHSSQPRCRLLGDDSHHNPHRHHALGHGPHPLRRSPLLLSPSPRRRPIILQLDRAPKDHPVVLRDRPHPELLAQRPLRPQLGLPLELQPRQSVADRPARHPLLRLRLGRLPLALRHPFKRPQLDPPRLRHRPRRPALVPNALGNLKHRAVRPLGRGSSSQRACGSQSLAMARRARLASRSRLWHDPAADADEDPYRVHAHRGTGAGIHRDDSGPRDGTE